MIYYGESMTYKYMTSHSESVQVSRGFLTIRELLKTIKNKIVTLIESGPNKIVQVIGHLSNWRILG